MSRTSPEVGCSRTSRSSRRLCDHRSPVSNKRPAGVSPAAARAGNKVGNNVVPVDWCEVGCGTAAVRGAAGAGADAAVAADTSAGAAAPARDHGGGRGAAGDVSAVAGAGRSDVGQYLAARGGHHRACSTEAVDRSAARTHRGDIAAAGRVEHVDDSWDRPAPCSAPRSEWLRDLQHNIRCSNPRRDSTGVSS